MKSEKSDSMAETKVSIAKNGIDMQTIEESRKSSRRRTSSDRTRNRPAARRKHLSFTAILMSVKQYYKTMLDSKLPSYLCLITYIFICLLGNVVTAIVLIKHRQIFSNENNINDGSPLILPSQINQSQGFENDIDLEETVNEDILLGLLDLVYNESQHEVILSKYYLDIKNITK